MVSSYNKHTPRRRLFCPSAGACGGGGGGG